MRRTVRSAQRGCAVLLGLALLAAPLGAQELRARSQAPAPIQGLLLAAESGEPLAGAEVSVRPLPPQRHPSRHDPSRRRPGEEDPEPRARGATVRGTSDGRGAFALRPAGGGPLQVVVRARGRLPLTYTLLPGAPSRHLPPVDVPTAHPMRLLVVTESGDPVPGASVTLLAAADAPPWDRVSTWGWQPLARRGTTDGDGGLTLSVADREELWIRGEAPGFSPTGPLQVPGATARALRSGADPLRVTLAPAPPAGEKRAQERTGEPSAPRPVAGRLLDPRGEPVHAFVWADTDPGGAVPTEADGSFLLPASPDARWIVAAADGRRSRVERIADLLSREKAVALRLESAAEVAGQVVDPAGRPIPRVRIEAVLPESAPEDGPEPGASVPRRLIVERPAVTWTGADGRFRLGGLPALDRYTLRAVRQGFRDRRIEGTAAEAGALQVVLEPNRTAFGSVLDPDERPTSGAEVLLEPQGEPGGRSARRAVTDDHGRFEIPDVDAGRWTLVVRHPEHATTRVPGLVIPRPRGPVDLGTVVLGRSAVLSGLVLEPRGQAVEGARVHLYGDLGEQARGRTTVLTDRAGGFRLEGLTPGNTVDLRVEHPDHVTARLDRVLLPPPEPLTIALEDGFRLSGRVVDEEGAGVAEARVRLDPPAGQGPPTEGLTGSGGRFTLDGLRAGAYGAVAHATGYRDSVRLEVEVDEATPPVELVLRRGAEVFGRVLTPGGDPARDATVRVVDSPSVGEAQPSSRTDAEGRYRLEGVEPGRRLLEARHPRYPPQRLQIEAAPGDNHRDFVLEPGSEVSGRVISSAGTPLRGATVELAGAGPAEATTSARADGSFRLDAVAPGLYRLEARHPGHAPGRIEGVEVGPVGVSGLEIVLEPGATIVGQVHGLELEDLGRLEVRATDGSIALLLGEVDYSGRYRVDGASPGDWWVSGELPDGRTAEAAVAVPPGAPRAAVDLEFSPPAPLRGRVLLAGEPLPDAEITLARPGARPRAAVLTDRDGRFELADAPADGGLLRVIHAGRGVSHQQEVPPGAERVLVDLPGASLAGTVRSASGGEPIDGAQVTVELVGPSEPVRRSVRSGPDGSFRLPDLQAGRWQVSATAEGFAPAEAVVELSSTAGSPSVTLDLEPTAGLEIDLRLPSGAAPTIAHAALLDTDGRPVLAGTFPADRRGRIHLDAPAGAWRLLASSPGTATLDAPVTSPGLEGPFQLPAGGSLEVELTELSRPDLLARLSVEATNGHPVPVVGFGGRLATDYPVVRGRARIDGLPPGGWVVRAVAEDGSRWSAHATVVPGTVTTLVLTPEARRP